MIGTVLSGLLYQWFGLVGWLWASAGFAAAAGLVSLLLPTDRTTPVANRHPAWI